MKPLQTVVVAFGVIAIAGCRKKDGPQRPEQGDRRQ